MSKIFSYIYFLSVALFLSSCAVQKPVIPVFEEFDPKEVLSEKKHIKTLESTFTIEIERDEGELKGEGVAIITRDTLDLRIYSPLGFLLVEVVSDETVTKSNPPFDKSRLTLLVEGLRNSFFWWNIREPEVTELESTYRVSNSWRNLFLNKKTALPEQQILDLEEGRQLRVIYDDPVFYDDMWFPSKMRVELSRSAVTLTIKTLTANKGRR